MQRSKIERTCKTCGKKFKIIRRKGRGKYCSRECFYKSSSWRRKGEFKKPESYGACHLWLIRNFGKATHCEDSNCEKKSKTYEYALIKGKKHSHNRKHYMRMCASCHKKYDMTDEWRKKIGLAHIGNKMSKEARKKISNALIGNKNSCKEILDRIKRKCKLCSKEFLVCKNSSYRKYCSHQCYINKRYNK